MSDPRIVRECVERWTPGGQADADQDHAEALETMRRCKTYLVCYVEDDADENGETGGFYIGMQGTAVQALKLLATTESSYAQLTRLIATRLIPLVVEQADEEDAAA